MPKLMPIAGSDAERPLKSEQDTQRYTPTPRRNPRAAPTVGIFDAPYRCLKINLEWWSHISGMIDTLSSEELWLGDVEEQARALRQIAALLSYDECGDTFDMTPEEFKQSLYEGLYQWSNDVAKQIVSGGIGGFSVDDDGNVTVGGGGDTPVVLPPDDPATPFDDSLAAQMGGTIEVSRALELFYDKLDTYYGATNGTPTTLEATTQAFIKAFFPCDEAAMDAAITAYYAYRATNGRIIFDVNATIQNYMFCRGGGERAWNMWLSDQSAYAIAKFNIVKQLSDALSDDFWTDYFANGAEKPSTQYLDASCVKIPDQTLTGLTFGVARSSTIIKPLHRYLFIWDGLATDTDGDTQDPFWFRTAAGVLTFTTPTIVHSAGSNLPSSTQVPYNSSHHYEYTTDSQNLAGNAYVITMNKHASLNATGLVYTNAFNVTIKDLGEYAV